jgi:AGZA family xanthine/uracil permease-like MFS transporter
MGIGWQQCLGAVFVSGLAFVVITLLGVRRWLAQSISPSLKHSFAVGIGLFLALVGLYEAGIVTSSITGTPPAPLLSADTGLLGAPAVPLKIGDLHDTRVLLAVLGFLATVGLMQRRVRGALLLGIALTAVVGLAAGVGEAPQGIVAMPFVGEYSLAPIALQLDVKGVLQLGFLPVLLTLFLMGFLDTLGTLVGVGAAGDLLDERGDFPQIERPMLVDAVTCSAAGLLGTTTSGAYIESATGIREGARTGLAAVTTATLFAASLFFIPLVEPLQRLQYSYAPALVVVGLLMIGAVRRIDFEDLTELVPAFATIVMMVFTYNIANGLTAGLLVYPLVKLLAGRWREVSGGSLLLAVACAAYYLFGLPH